jgi:hypothetical protein
MKRTATAGAVAALVAVFVAITVSVVDAERTLDSRVSRSFVRALTSVGAPAGSLRPTGCTKIRRYFYHCYASVLPPRRRVRATVEWRLFLTDNGCWTMLPPFPAPTVLGALAPRLQSVKGCTG